jgi:L-ribulose-5-phosphate 3-epimerase UlaE
MKGARALKKSTSFTSRLPSFVTLTMELVHVELSVQAGDQLISRLSWYYPLLFL